MQIMRECIYQGVLNYNHTKPIEKRWLIDHENIYFDFLCPFMKNIDCYGCDLAMENNAFKTNNTKL